MAEGNAQPDGRAFAHWHQAIERSNQLLAERKPKLALQVTQRALRDFPHNTELLRRHAKTAERLVSNDPDHATRYADIALEHYSQAARAEPANASTAAGLARLLDRRGDRDRARAVLLPHLDGSPPDRDVAMAFAALAPRFGEIERAIALIERAIGQRETSQLRHVQARLLDRAGRYDQSFAAAERANELVGRHYDETGFREGALATTVDAISAATPRTAMLAAGTARRRSDLPVFIVGMGRSGTTLVEQIISGHPQAAGAGERRALLNAVTSIAEATGTGFPSGLCRWPVDALDRVHDRYVAELQALAPGAIRISDKLPQNFLRLGVIQRLLPGARIIHTQRNPLDVCLSAYYQDQKIPAMEPWDLYRAGLCYRDYERMMAHWRSVLDVQVLDVQYENLVARPEVEARRIIAFLELPWDERCLAVEKNTRVVDTSNYEAVRRPIHSDAVGRWRHYEQQLTPLMRALGGRARDGSAIP
ncbi:sulfotransferase family protein [Stella humosa]|uniref:Sulfotransferase family protein n=2 Tax=Stella humosa TaxID=94 RepID=A0A3N1KZM6_9PROT|nr:sulfotransferase [Stella humosa]ROP83656.1 sulfotransferase family protein [Stella humosa]BBK33071.1 hypothetical protein STHU_37050 [Stella humosa]